jgi:hypothetical protein
MSINAKFRLNMYTIFICVPHDQFREVFSYSLFLNVRFIKCWLLFSIIEIQKQTIARNVMKLITWYTNRNGMHIQPEFCIYEHCTWSDTIRSWQNMHRNAPGGQIFNFQNTFDRACDEIRMWYRPKISSEPRCSFRPKYSV